jgi:hypothetical protein
MNSLPRLRFVALVLAGLTLAACSSGKQTLGREVDADAFLPGPGGSSYFARWEHGPPSDAAFVPLMVWMQNPANASRFQDVGVNFFTGLWEGPTADQLSGLTAAKMPAVCDQSGVWRSHVTDPSIKGWLQVDQPDDAQMQSDGTYAPCIEPSVMAARYAAMTQSDPTRPVFMNLGRGVVDGNWVGRGACKGRNDMYPAYARGADVVTFVTYPVNDGLPLETMAQGVDALRNYVDDEKPVIAGIEASDIDGVGTPTAAQIQAEVWMAFIHGATGIQYFCHRLDPAVNETACLDDDGTSGAMRQIDEQVTSLAPVLNSRSLAHAVVVTSDVTVDTMVKRDATTTHLFAVSMGTATTTAHFELARFGGSATAEVLGEQRNVELVDGAFDDSFLPYAVHVYRIRR